MNKLFAALLLFTIIEVFPLVEEAIVMGELNGFREEIGKEKKIEMKPVIYLNKLEEMAKKICDSCPDKKDIKPEPGYKVYAEKREGSEIPKHVFMKVLSDPKTTAIGFCNPDEKTCKKYDMIYIVDSAMAYSLTFLMAFVMIFSGI